MRRLLGLVVLVLALLAGGWYLRTGESARPAEVGSAGPVKAAAAGVRSPSPGSGPAERAKARSRAERDRVRRRIVDAIAARGRAGGPGAATDEPARAAAADDPKDRAADLPPRGEEPAAGGLVDRSGNHGYLLRVMNEELMPLADECYALARASQPELAGMLALDVELLGDAEIGGVVDVVRPSAINELHDPLLLECMRESILSVTLPAPPQGGRDALMLSMPLAPEETG